VHCDSPLEAELLAVGGQQKFDRCGVEADAVIQRDHPVAFVDPADGDHGLEDLDVADVAGVAGEKRLEEERSVGGDDVVDPATRNVYSREISTPSTISSAWTITTPSWKAAASAIVGVSSVLGPV
jgi:hypothetical protein